MSRKRMILEEVQEPNQLVPGSPDNPLKIGEKAKNILVRMKIYEDDGRTGDPTAGNQYDTDYRYAMERLEFLQLIEYRPKYDATAIARKQTAISELRVGLAQSAMTMASDDIVQVYRSINTLENALQSNDKVAWMTDAGRALLLTGTVTVSL